MANCTLRLVSALLAACALPAQSTLDPAHPIPRDKDLPAAWLQSLIARGEPTVLGGWEQLQYIGMPVSGIGCGTVYLGGDGHLWCWDIFNVPHEGVVPNVFDGDDLSNPFGAAVRERDGASYVRPVVQRSPWQVALDFTVQIGDAAPRPLDHRGFHDITFEWRYPIGRVTYTDAAAHLRIELEAFTPFVPLDVDRSSLPATLLRYRVVNDGDTPQRARVFATVANPVLCLHPEVGSRRRTTTELAVDGGAGVLCATAAVPAAAVRADVPFDDFEGAGWGDWQAEGEAFARGPFPWRERASYHDVRGHHGARYVTSHDIRGGLDCGDTDNLTGTLQSPPFVVARHFVNLRLAGGRRDDAYVEVVVDGVSIARRTGHDGNDLRPSSLDVRSAAGKTAVLRIVDQAKGGWGNITLDDIVFSDRSTADVDVEQLGDFGSFAVVCARGDAATTVADAEHGTVGAQVDMPAGGSAEFPFAVAWHFANASPCLPQIPGLAEADRRRAYAARFADAAAVARSVVAQLDELTRLTRLWCDTWYGGTLPRWLLERTLVTVDTLQTSTFHRFTNGHVWSWEGVGSCAGTCTHVWHYAQAMARLFPALERDLRERTDFGIAFRDGGLIDFRGGLAGRDASDGQAGVVLRTYREHLCSRDGAFLQRVWPRCRQALEFLIAQDARDGEPDGLLAGEQANTLDAEWYGAIPAISSLYLAALLAGEQMATLQGDGDFAARCRDIAARGRQGFAALFDRHLGFFVQREDPQHPDAIGTGLGCYIDQVIGQGWAQQLDLGRITDAGLVQYALGSLWQYNFAPDMGAVRASFADPKLRGRPYALAGERGLVMCTWPFGGRRSDWEKHWQFGYFQECMTGFEHMAAAQMLWEGTPELIEHSLAVERAIHDRYTATQRNPFNEIECSDHYTRAMASYGVFLAACGFDYDGPRGHLGFAPRLGADDFRGPFTAAAGWGQLSQRRGDDALRAGVEVRRGELRLATISLSLPVGRQAKAASIDGAEVRWRQDGARVLLTLPTARTLHAGEAITIVVSW